MARVWAWAKAICSAVLLAPTEMTAQRLTRSGEGHGPFEGARTAHGSAQHRVPAPDAQGVGQPRLGLGAVPQGDQREP